MTKLDMDLIRTFLLAVEEASPSEVIQQVGGYTEEEFAYNVGLLEQAGLVEASVATSSGHIPVAAHVCSLTWAGPSSRFVE